jgi:hypothetical protein
VYCVRNRTLSVRGRRVAQRHPDQQYPPDYGNHKNAQPMYAIDRFAQTKDNGNNYSYADTKPAKPQRQLPCKQDLDRPAQNGHGECTGIDIIKGMVHCKTILQQGFDSGNRIRRSVFILLQKNGGITNPLVAPASNAATSPSKAIPKASIDPKRSAPSLTVSPQNPIPPTGSDKMAIECITTISIVILIRCPILPPAG